MDASAVDSWPPPGVPVEMKTPAYFPCSPPLVHSLPVASQNACECAFQKAIGLGVKLEQRTEAAYLPLSWEVTVTSGDPEEECIEGGQFLWSDDFIGGFWRGIHLCEDFFRKRLRNSCRRAMR